MNATIYRSALDVLEVKGRDIIGVQKDSSVRNAIRLICEAKVGASVVKEGGDIVGIWTERDLLREVLSDGFSLDDPIEKHMTRNLFTVDADTTLVQLMDKFLALRIRHLLITEGGKITGILSIGDVTKANLQNKARELEEANSELETIKELVSLRYYENQK